VPVVRRLATDYAAQFLSGFEPTSGRSASLASATPIGRSTRVTNVEKPPFRSGTFMDSDANEGACGRRCHDVISTSAGWTLSSARATPTAKTLS
jgi:hypothetical protein